MPRSQPARAARTNEKKSRCVHAPIKNKPLLQLSPPPNKPRPKNYTSARTPIQSAAFRTKKSESAILWAVRFSDNFPQPVIKCLKSTRVGCVGFLQRGNAIKISTNIIFNWTEFCACVRPCSLFFFPVQWRFCFFVTWWLLSFVFSVRCPAVISKLQLWFAIMTID